MTRAGLQEALSNIAMKATGRPYFSDDVVTNPQMEEIVYQVMRLAEQTEEANERMANGKQAEQSNFSQS